MKDLHISGVKTINQYKLIEYILKHFNFTDYRDFLCMFKVEFLNDYQVKVIDKDNDYAIFTCVDKVNDINVIYS